MKRLFDSLSEDDRLRSAVIEAGMAGQKVSRWQPRLGRLSAGPGTAKTSRFRDVA